MKYVEPITIAVIQFPYVSFNMRKNGTMKNNRVVSTEKISTVHKHFESIYLFDLGGRDSNRINREKL